MSEHPNEGADAGGGGDTPAANQTEPEATPTSDAQSAPPAGNLAGADPQAPTPVAQSAVATGGVPRPIATGRSGAPGRPGDTEPDSSDSSRPVTGSGGGAGSAQETPSRAAKPDGEVST
jgi:hypothetical protein